MSLTPFRTALLSIVASTTVTGTLAVTDADDTLSAAGAPVVVGALAASETADTLSATGTPVVVGSLTVTDSPDTLSASGAGPVSGTLTVADVADTLVAAGTPVIVGTLAATEGADTLAVGPSSVGPRIALVWQDHSKTVSYQEGGRVIGRLSYAAHAEDPGTGIWWTDRTKTLVDFSSGYTWSLKITDGVTTLLTKTSGITGAAGSGTAPDGTPNITIDWSTGELALTPGEYTLELTPTSNSRQRDPIRVPFRIEASAP